MGNAVFIDFDALVRDTGARLRIVANLPYNVGTALFIGWLSGESWPPQ